MSINLRDAAKFDEQLPHQLDAWNWLQTQLTPDVLESFAVKYRKKPTASVEIPNTWAGVIQAAKQAGAKFPEVVAAQWQLESAGGTATSGKHNYFGLKGSGTSVATKEFIDGKWIENEYQLNDQDWRDALKLMRGTGISVRLAYK